LIWGTRFECIAKEIYENETRCTITDVSCVQHPVYPFLGASPDGIIFPTDPKDVRRRGRLVEFKCPFSRVAKDGVPAAYIHQMQMQMACTGRVWCDYVVFDPRMPLKVQMFVKRIPRDIKFIAEMEAEIVKFLAEVEAQLNKLTQLIESK
jgi:hypothetical protein